MAHTSRMAESDKCATKGFASLRKDFFDSLTGSYVDITFKVTGVFTLLMVVLVSPLLILRYRVNGLASVYESLAYLGPTFVFVYLVGYYWVYQNVYTPVHEISTRLLAEQKSIDAWPDEDEVSGKDILDWQYKEIEALLEAIIDLQKRADRLGRGELNVKEMSEKINQGYDFANAVEEVTVTTDRDGEMIETFESMEEALRKLAYQAELIKEGDLANQALDVKIEGDLGNAFQQMVSNLQEFVREVREAVSTARNVSTEVDQAANELNKASQELSSGAQESSSSLEETSASVEEMASMVQQTNENASECEKLTNEAVETAEEGQEQINAMAETMEQINDDSEQISDAIEMIDDIAFQTNLLALNAAVEAANAGEHGEGFAVVADEVRELAQRSAEAAEEISDVIEQSSDRTEDGKRKAERSREVFNEISDKIDQVRERVREVAAAQEEQSNGIEEINRAITELETVTQQNTANADETASSSNELASQSEHLKKAVTRLDKVSSQYKVSGGDTRESMGTQQEPQRDVTTDTNGPSSENGEQSEEDIIPLEEDNPDF